jgi:prolyl-tRNA synthetase
VVRWEKTTRPFLRTLEFLWQEGHTAHATQEEAQEETIRMLNVYADFCEKYLAIPVIKGQKTDKEKFAGAKATYTIESLMHDGKALQSGTSHNFGDGFAKAFEIQYTDQNNSLKYVHQTSWGLSTRIIGAIIMVYGDDSGLVLPPAIAPVQAVIIPVSQHKEGVLEKANEIRSILSSVIRVKIDDSDKQPGWKFSEYEMKGIPVRIEIGPKDLEKNQVVIVRRDNRQKMFVGIDELETQVPRILEEVQQSLYQKALSLRESKTYKASAMDEFERTINETPGFVKAMWCGDRECEEAIKEKTGATSRCIPFEQEKISDTCICCGKPAHKMVYWGRAY